MAWKRPKSFVKSRFEVDFFSTVFTSPYIIITIIIIIIAIIIIIVIILIMIKLINFKLNEKNRMIRAEKVPEDIS